MPEATNRKLDTRWLWLPAIVLLVGVFFGVRRLTRQDLPVRTARVERHDLTRPNSTTGKVEPQKNFEAPAPFSGVIKKLDVHAGEQVSAGQLLLSMEDADAVSRVATALTGLRGAQSNLATINAGGTQEEQLNLSENTIKAQTDVDVARKNLETLQQLQAKGSASANEVNTAQQTLTTATVNLQALEKRKTQRYAKGDIEHSQASVADAQASYRAAQAVIAQSNVHAPFAGTVYSLPVSQTEYVQQGQQLLELADLSKLQIRAYFDEPDIGTLAIGQAATIVWDAKRGHQWTGHVVRLPTTIINYNTRNVGETIVSIDPSNETLLPNVNVTVTVTTQHVQNALTIPRDALHREAGTDYVFLVQGNAVHRRVVHTGAINLTQAQILSGLVENDVVALGTTNGEPLAEGVPIRQIQ